MAEYESLKSQTTGGDGDANSYKFGLSDRLLSGNSMAAYLNNHDDPNEYKLTKKAYYGLWSVIVVILSLIIVLFVLFSGDNGADAEKTVYYESVQTASPLPAGSVVSFDQTTGQLIAGAGTSLGRDVAMYTDPNERGDVSCPNYLNSIALQEGYFLNSWVTKYLADNNSNSGPSTTLQVCSLLMMGS
jgi:hypothetical protein